MSTVYSVVELNYCSMAGGVEKFCKTAKQVGGCVKEIVNCGIMSCWDKLLVRIVDDHEPRVVAYMHKVYVML